MRFDGSDGHRDHVVTDSEKKNMRLILELYSYYDNLDTALEDLASAAT